VTTSNSTRTSAAACLLIVASCSGSGGGAPRPERRVSTSAGTVVPLPTVDTQPARQSTQAAIQDIQKRYADIRTRLQSFREVDREVSGLSTEGGTLKAFFDGGTLRLVKATFYGETGRVDREFYYDDRGSPFFAFEKESQYETPLTAVARAREYRYYFHEGRLIRLIDGERQISSEDSSYAARVKAQLALSSRLADIARRR
jgi:hypothetical protein